MIRASSSLGRWLWRRFSCPRATGRVADLQGSLRIARKRHAPTKWIFAKLREEKLNQMRARRSAQIGV